ncbi:unnamed protein product [Caenorhabditis sp. 36 PRJEB53466]|nr:unnamed protein product [Caenorhabditis sp. 36 PRJEB53466]
MPVPSGYMELLLMSAAWISTKLARVLTASVHWKLEKRMEDLLLTPNMSPEVIKQTEAALFFLRTETQFRLYIFKKCYLLKNDVFENPEMPIPQCPNLKELEEVCGETRTEIFMSFAEVMNPYMSGLANNAMKAYKQATIQQLKDVQKKKIHPYWYDLRHTSLDEKVEIRRLTAKVYYLHQKHRKKLEKLENKIDRQIAAFKKECKTCMTNIIKDSEKDLRKVDAMQRMPDDLDPMPDEVRLFFDKMHSMPESVQLCLDETRSMPDEMHTMPEEVRLCLEVKRGMPDDLA